MQMKSFGLDRRAMAIDPGCDVHLEAGVAGGPRHRQAVRDEIPILGDEIDERAGAALRGSAAAGGPALRGVRELRDRADDVIEARCSRRLENEAIVHRQLVEP